MSTPGSHLMAEGQRGGSSQHQCKCIPPGSSPGCGVESQLRLAVGELQALSGVCVLCSPQEFTSL